MGQVVRGKIQKGDLLNWDGKTLTGSRVDATSGTITGLVTDYEVDVLEVFGDSTNYTVSTISKATQHIGSSNVTLVFAPGTWAIDADITIASNFTCRISAGVIFDISSGKTLTFSGPVLRESDTWTSGSGTVSGGDVRLGTNVDINAALIAAALVTTPTVLSIYPRTAAEISAGVTPTNFSYEPGNILRYGTNTTPGTTDMTAAFTAALAVVGRTLVPAGIYSLSTWTVYSGTNDIYLYGEGKPSIIGPGYTGGGSANFLASLGNIHIEGIKFSEFIAVCASLPTALNDSFDFIDNETTNTVRAINLNAGDPGSGYKTITVKGNTIKNTSYGAYLIPREMHNTIVTNNKFIDLSNSWSGASIAQAVHIGLDTVPGTRLNAIVSNNIFENIINSGNGETQAIMIHDVRRCVVNDNIIDTITGATIAEGIYLREVDMDATCSGNVLVDVAGTCIAAKSGQSIISGNRISGRDLIPFAGIDQIEKYDCVIDGNWISGCYFGISSLSPVGTPPLQSRNEIRNNVITDCVRGGIYAAGRSRSQVITGNIVKRITGGDVVAGGIVPDDINVGIEMNYVTGGGTRAVCTNNHVSEILGSSTNPVSPEGFDSVAFRLITVNGEIFASLNSYDQVDYGFWVEDTVYIQNNFLNFAAAAIYHPSSSASASSVLQTYLRAGLAFPSNQDQLVADPNSLDDYQEGTWTPSVGRTGTFGSYTPGSNDGAAYTKIGNIVYFSVRVDGTSAGASGGIWVIRGLPFTSANDFKWGRTIVTAYDATATTAFAFPRIIENSKDINFGTLVSGNDVYCSGFYFTS